MRCENVSKETTVRNKRHGYEMHVDPLALQPSCLTKEEWGKGLLASGCGGCACQAQKFGVDSFNREKNK